MVDLLLALHVLVSGVGEQKFDNLLGALVDSLQKFGLLHRSQVGVRKHVLGGSLLT